jgi:hypothetical protein
MKRENCECLAFWVDSEPCICGEQIGPPMEVSAKKLREAEQLVRSIQHMDRELAKLAKDKPYCRTLIYTGSGSHDLPPLELRLPPDIAAGLIRTMRFHALVKLSETGVVSTSSGHRPVVSA